jgi:hypothetical protein
MTRIRLLNDEINAVDTEAKARKLVKVWMGAGHAAAIDQAGVRNCSLIAEWVIQYINVGVVDYEKLSISKPVALLSRGWPGAVQALPFRNGSRADVFYLTALAGSAGHELAVLREGATYGLFHAWHGQFHVFPRLNPQNMNPNIFGDGDATLQRIMDLLTQGDSVGGVKMPREWEVRTGWTVR